MSRSTTARRFPTEAIHASRRACTLATVFDFDGPCNVICCWQSNTASRIVWTASSRRLAGRGRRFISNQTTLLSIASRTRAEALTLSRSMPQKRSARRDSSHPDSAAGIRPHFRGSGLYTSRAFMSVSSLSALPCMSASPRSDHRPATSADIVLLSDTSRAPEEGGRPDTTSHLAGIIGGLSDDVKLTQRPWRLADVTTWTRQEDNGRTRGGTRPELDCQNWQAMCPNGRIGRLERRPGDGRQPLSTAGTGPTWAWLPGWHGNQSCY